MANFIDVVKNKNIINYILSKEYSNKPNTIKKYKSGIVTLKNDESISIYDINFAKKIYDLGTTFIKNYYTDYHNNLIIYMKSIGYLSNYIKTIDDKYLVNLTTNTFFTNKKLDNSSIKLKNYIKLELSNINFVDNLQQYESYNVLEIVNNFNKRELLKEKNIDILRYLYNNSFLNINKEDEHILLVYIDGAPIYKMFSVYDENLEKIVISSYCYVNECTKYTPSHIERFLSYRRKKEIKELILEAKYEYKMYNLTGKLKNTIFLEWFKKLIKDNI